MDIPASLHDYIENSIVPQYEFFDMAHRTGHVRQVIDESLKLVQHYAVDVRLVYTIAACHDIGLCEGREHHHLVSGRLIRTDEHLREWFSEAEIELMAQAAEDHRASNEHTPRSIYGRIVAEADRLINPIQILRRTIQYGLSHYPELSKEQHYHRYCKHLQEKYAEGGYLKLWIPESSNVSRLKDLRKIIADEPQRRAAFEQLFGEEVDNLPLNKTR